MQDLLCDSGFNFTWQLLSLWNSYGICNFQLHSLKCLFFLRILGMIPYTEPYQSMYQQRRLGALGVEWKPSSVRFAVGPDFSLDPDNQMLALADLDVLVEPLPDFIDAMDWEPENDMQSDENDSEYNAPEENSSEAEQGRSNYSSSGDPECSAEDSEAEGRDGFRGSKRRKQKAEVHVFKQFSFKILDFMHA
jgi:PH-interacting protein